MRAFLTILLLLCSNVVMTFAWYGNLKLKEMNPDKDWPLYLVILCSWGLALFEYCFMIPANRIGSDINGGPFNLMQLKIIQESISLTVFTLIATHVQNCVLIDKRDYLLHCSSSMHRNQVFVHFQ